VPEGGDLRTFYPLRFHPLDQTQRDRNVAKCLRLRVDFISRIELVFCEQSAVAMRVVARLASVKLAFLSSLDTTGWTRNRGNLLWGEFFSHSEGQYPKPCGGVGTPAHSSKGEGNDNDSEQNLGLQPT
jgi:hypothetical protein